MPFKQISANINHPAEPIDEELTPKMGETDYKPKNKKRSQKKNDKDCVIF